MTVREIMVGYPGSKDITVHPYYRGPLSRKVWSIYHHRFTRGGRWFMGISATSAFLFGLYWSLEIQTWLLLAYCAAAWLVAVPAFLFAPRTQVAVKMPDRATAGKPVPVDMQVTNNGKLPVHDLAVHPWGLPLDIDAETEDGIPVGSLAPGETKRIRFTLSAKHRGSHTLAGWRTETDFPLGLVCAYRVHRMPAPLVVHPNWKPIARFDLPLGRRYQPGGVALAAKIGDAFEYAGNREWRSGDRPRDVDWRSTARHMGSPEAKLVVKEWREEYFIRVAVVLDTWIPKPPPITRVLSRSQRERLESIREGTEASISLCASIADVLAQQDYLIDLFAAGPDLFPLTIGRGLSSRDQILDLLSCVEPTSDETLERIAPQLTEHVARLTTVVLVTNRWDASRQNFVENLRLQGVGARPVVILPEGAPIPTDRDARFLHPSDVAAGLDHL